ncbi:MAG: DUF2589 domain-containing protein [Bacteroidota bacterium]
MANIPAILRDLPLEHIIGAPLQAAIKAQALAARTTVDFIKDVGLKAVAATDLAQTALPSGATADPAKGDDAPDGDATKGYEARYVEFKFDRIVEEQLVIPPASGSPAGTPSTTATRHTLVPSRLTVPLLSIVPIPFIRVSDMNISFEYSIKDIATSESKSEKNVSAEVKGKYWFVSATVKGSYTNQSVNKRETDQRATLKITVNAVQDRMPEGLSKVLDMLHENMKVVPLSSGSVIALPPPPSS